MRTTWTSWKPDEMQDRATAEARTALVALAVPERDFLESLPYFSAFDEYRWHVTDCPDCLNDDHSDCPEGEALRAVARLGLKEQASIALHN